MHCNNYYYVYICNYVYLLSQNAILCLLFGIALLAGAITNSMYGSDNLDRYDNSGCIDYDGGYGEYDTVIEKLCDDFETPYITESAAAVS